MSDKSSVEIPIVCICGEKKMDDMMHMMDVFEPFKALATVQKMVITRTSEPTSEQFGVLVKALRDALETTGYRVVAVFSPNRKEGAWKDDTVKCISDGEKWCMIDPVLEAYSWPNI